MVKKCSTCQQNQRKQQHEPMKAEDVPQYPFQMVGSDSLNSCSQDFVLVVDYYSRYWDIEKLYRTDSATVIKKLNFWYSYFSRMGIPEVMRIDNEPQYSSTSFKTFAKDWKFQHIASSPEYPRSNGLAEKTAQIVKSLLEKAKDENKDPHLTMLKAKKHTSWQLQITSRISCWKTTKISFTCKSKQLKIKTIDDDEFKERRRKDKKKQSKDYDQHTKEMGKQWEC